MPRPLNYPSGCREIFTSHHTAQIPIGFFSCSLPNRSIAERDAWAFFLTKLFTTLPRSSYLSVAENAEKSFGVLVNFFTSFPSASLQLKRKKKVERNSSCKNKKSGAGFSTVKDVQPLLRLQRRCGIGLLVFFRVSDEKTTSLGEGVFFTSVSPQGWLRGCFKPWS